MDGVKVPTLLVSGTVGAGKTALADEVAVLLNEKKIRHALIDLDWLCQLYPAPAEDRFRDDLMFKNLTAIWPHYRDIGVDYLVLARVIEDPAELGLYRRAIPEADIKVVRVMASLHLIQQRLQNRERRAQRSRAPALISLKEGALCATSFCLEEPSARPYAPGAVGDMASPRRRC